MKKRLVAILFSAVLFLGFMDIDLVDFVFPSSFPEPLYDLNENPLSKAKIELGRVLFYDPLLSADETISCASCHSPYNAFAHTDHDLSHGIHDQIGTRNAPALFNLAWQKTFMWDGAVNHLDMQALAPLEHPAEMGATLREVIDKLQDRVLYKSLFKNAFGDSLVTSKRFLKAIAQFQLTLVSGDSKYDKVISGKAAFTPQEKNGYNLFKANCASCHAEPLFTTGDFANNGLPVDTTMNDLGRISITNNPADAYKFKIPSLRNLEYTKPYMHDGRFENLSEVIKHYMSGIHASHTLAEELKDKMLMNKNEQVDLVAFLLTLSDKDFVFNPKHQFPRRILLNTK